MGPEQALSLQAMAGQMALKAAIKDVVAAIERVEGKVDKISALVKAERLGAVVADRATLLPLAERLRTTGQLSNTDWATIASLGPWIARDIESLRSYIVDQLQNVGEGRMVRSRTSDAEELTDQLVTESLALLVVAEQNYALWQELRIGHAAVHERNAVNATISDVHQQLKVLTRSDQALVHHLSLAVLQLTAPTGYEGLAPLKKRKLKEHAQQLAAVRTWFAEQRHLDYDEAELPDFPGFGESLSKIGQAISTTIRSLSDGSPSDEAAIRVSQTPALEVQTAETDT